MGDLEYSLISVGFIVYMGIHWLTEVAFSFYTEFSK